MRVAIALLLRGSIAALLVILIAGSRFQKVPRWGSPARPKPFLCDFELAMQLRPFSCHGVVMRMIVDTLRAQYDGRLNPNFACKGELSLGSSNSSTSSSSLLPELPPVRAPRARIAVFFHIGLAPRYELAARRVYTALKHSGLAEVVAYGFFVFVFVFVPKKFGVCVDAAMPNRSLNAHFLPRGLALVGEN